MIKQDKLISQTKSYISANSAIRELVVAKKQELGLPASVPLHLVPYIAYYDYTDGFYDAQIHSNMDNGNGGVQILETSVKAFIAALKECYIK